CIVPELPRTEIWQMVSPGKDLEQNVSAGVMVVGKSLVLQKVTRRHAGVYSCSATNSQGFNSSKPVMLNVKYSPVCRVEQSDVYGVGRLEKTTVTCRVEADPPATAYRWAFNNTGEFVDIPESHFIIKSDGELGQRSDLRYSPVSDLDYGTLLCWARNSVGNQRVPCTFTVFPAGKPDTVASCKATNQTEESVVVVCEPGYSGGVNQSFLLEAWDDGSLRATDRSDTPTLEASGLRPGTRYNLRVYAENSMGRSQPFSFKAFTLTDVAERRTAIGTGKEGQPLSPVIGSIVGASVSLLLLVLAGVAVARCKRHDDHENRSSFRETGQDEPGYKSFRASEGDVAQQRDASSSPRPTTTLSDDEHDAQVTTACDLVSASQDSILMSRSQDSNTPLLTTGRSSEPTTSIRADAPFTRQGSLTRTSYAGAALVSQASKTRAANLSPGRSAQMGGFSPSYAYHQQFSDAEAGSKWPPETWMGDSPFLFSSSTKGMRALDPETPTGGPRAPISSHALASPLSSPGSVDLRRHSAYMRPFDQVQTLEEEKDRLIRLPCVAEDRNSDEFSQHSLLRQNSSRKGSPRSAGTASSPFGFSSSTLNPRQFASQSLSKGIATPFVAGVTKPSSHITHKSSDHESSV
ncbi:uncharacterized protein LOC108681272, partial [Hyalella azteca]|uniref:Uncharacterized protein LOC108681272 n=1 Tax=Hyalella azteca TaxID=294128 RepID=A0A979FWI2_HYAAZ